MTASCRRRLLLSCLGLLAAAAPAQTGSDPAVIELEAFRTEGRRERAPELSGNLAGFAGDWQAVPRAVTPVNRQALDEFGIARVEDLAGLVAGAIAAPPYGVTGVPMMRGDLGDAAQNGQRRAYNRNVLPPSFNSVESVEILAGAPPAFLGFSGGTGGFANFVTKRPVLGRRSVTVELAAGRWDDYRGQLDANLPVTDRVAARVSLERIDRDGFFRLPGDRSLDAYVALAWQPAGGGRWDVSAEYLDARYAENPGTNRPTQALIDRGEYTTGSSVQDGGTGRYLGNTFTPTGTVRIDGSQVLAAPGDGAWARQHTVQLTGTLPRAGGRQVVSRTYFESVESEKHAAYNFYSYVPRSRTFEQRVEVQEERTWAGRTHELLWGAAVRGEERRVFVEFFNEAMNAFDLTRDPETFRFPTSQLWAVLPVPGRPGRWAQSGARYGSPASVGASQTLSSRLADAGVFLQDRVELGRGWTLVAGLRADALAVQSEDPLPRPGYAPVRDGVTKFLPGATLSLSWQPVRHTTAYLTLNDAAAVEASSSSGGFGLTLNRLPDELFENRSRLVEVGMKTEAADGRWSIGAALYRQERQRTNPRAGLPDEIRVQGLELAGGWRPAARFELTGNATLTDARYVDGPLPGGIATVPAFDPARPSDNFGAYARGDYRLPGQPRWQANVAARLTLTDAWSARLWSSFQGEQNLDLFGAVRIPPQQTWNAGLTWRRGPWEVRGDLLNLTDEFNWRPTSTPFAGGDLVTRELPRRWRLAVRHRY